MTIKCLIEHLLFVSFCAWGRGYRMNKKESLTQELTDWKSKEATLTVICRMYEQGGKCRALQGAEEEKAFYPRKAGTGMRCLFLLLHPAITTRGAL